MQPVRLFIDEHMVRAWPGGAGDAKIAGNYAPTVEPLVAAARDYGAQQSLFVLPQGPDRDDAVLSEGGGMNVMVFIDKVCPGSVTLPGRYAHSDGPDTLMGNKLCMKAPPV